MYTRSPYTANAFGTGPAVMDPGQRGIRQRTFHCANPLSKYYVDPALYERRVSSDPAAEWLHQNHQSGSWSYVPANAQTGSVLYSGSSNTILLGPTTHAGSSRRHAVYYGGIEGHQYVSAAGGMTGLMNQFPTPPTIQQQQPPPAPLPPLPLQLPPTPPPRLAGPSRRRGTYRDPYDGDSEPRVIPQTSSSQQRTDRRPTIPRHNLTKLESSRQRPIHVSSVCCVCLDSSSEFPRLPPTIQCTHKPTTCAPCLEQYLHHAIMIDGSTNVLCPDIECRQPLKHRDVRRGVRGNLGCYERYETLSLRRALENVRTFVWCKNPRCDAGQDHTSGHIDPLVACYACDTWSCFTHDIPWHTGFTCRQYDLQNKNIKREQEIASEEYINLNAKVCPNASCGRRIEKVDGCDHMTCRQPAGCGHEFCWQCLADYGPIRKDGNHHHTTSCKHYRAPGGRSRVRRRGPA